MAFFMDEAGIWVLPHIKDSRTASWIKAYWSYEKEIMEVAIQFVPLAIPSYIYRTVYLKVRAF